MTGKRIGFIDDDLNNFHANTFLDLIRGPLADRGYTVAGATALQAKTGAEWARDKVVEYYESIDALADQVDYFAILAPSTPNTHLGLCKQAFRHGKITFVDKIFAPDISTAERIFALADEAGVAVYTSSALARRTFKQQPLRSKSL